MCKKLQNMCHEIKGTNLDEIDNGGTDIQVCILHSCNFLNTLC